MTIRSRWARCAALVLAVALTLTVVGGPGAHPVAATVRVPATPAGLPLAIESMTEYVGQAECDPTLKPGTYKLASLLAQTYPGTWWSATYKCGTDGPRSEHYDGRAIDWGVSSRDATQAAEANAVIHWLLATDSQGNPFAMARRLGVMYLIFNGRIWGGWDGTWQPYEDCAQHIEVARDSYCHRNHMHISLSWNGAMGHTTFWTGQVSPTDYGPCRPVDLNWAGTTRLRHLIPCLWFPPVVAAAHASALTKALVTYSGFALHHGAQGPAVATVQSAVGVAPTGNYDMTTVYAVQRWQRAHHVLGTGWTTFATWRALLAVYH
jgi:hypothetical protein